MGFWDTPRTHFGQGHSVLMLVAGQQSPSATGVSCGRRGQHASLLDLDGAAEGCLADLCAQPGVELHGAR